ncbi:MAG: type IV pilin [Thermoplasmataceae archaeon]
MAYSRYKRIIRIDPEDRGVSSIIGTILMISITVIITIAIGVIAESYVKNLPPPPPRVTLIITNNTVNSGGLNHYHYNITFRTVSSPLRIYIIKLQFQGPNGYIDVNLIPCKTNTIFNQSGLLLEYRDINLYTNFSKATNINTSLDIEVKSQGNASEFFYNVNVIDTSINAVIGSGYPERNIP